MVRMIQNQKDSRANLQSG
uniref:Uncharacterized protein n=1 Tax=Rhizophora mucronata TaxID=61149 RepID=A0A2P2NZU7_RHIMU